METIWNFEGTLVVATGAEFASNPMFTGYAVAKKGRLCQWKAEVTPTGYNVFLYDSKGDSLRGVRQYDGATFNLGLEVATAVNM